MSTLGGALQQRRILLGVAGSIAAYKAPDVLRQLMKQGATVEVVLTESAERFISRAVFSGLGAKVYSGMWDGPGEPHVALASSVDCMLVAPATAQFLSGLRSGRADDLLSATALCFAGPLFVAPAMHPRMWDAPATQDNVACLATRGVRFLGPDFGEVASGDSGWGRMMAPESIVASLAQAGSDARLPLAGRHVVVTAGPTREPIDPVRALTNVSTGKMGYAIAQLAHARGARVTLVSGPVDLQAPPGVEVVRIESAAQLQNALSQLLGGDLKGADALIMAAAVSDYRPAHPSPAKLKRSTQDLHLALTPNPDLLAEIGARRTSTQPVLIGFALESQSGEELVRLARGKLTKKRVDLIVANAIQDSLGLDVNTVSLVSAEECVNLPSMDKLEVAAHLLDWLEQRLGA